MNLKTILLIIIVAIIIGNAVLNYIRYGIPFAVLDFLIMASVARLMYLLGNKSNEDEA
jgi:hypothetical protein